MVNSLELWVHGGANSDWENAFEVSTRDSKPEHHFTKEDITRVIRSADGENDGPSWVAVLSLTGNRFGYVSASCDYTGWGCQDSGTMVISNSLEEIVRMTCTEDERERMGLRLQESHDKP